MAFDLNCDLGEGEPMARTRALMRVITSANAACGGHAGDVDTMESCVRLCRQHHVRLGAHPGLWSRGDFGRTPGTLTADELELLLMHQISALERIARVERISLHHVKLHGALYHATDHDAVLARRYLKVMKRWWPKCIVFARAGGLVIRLARRAGVRVWAEIFADRGYREDGTLVPRDQPGAILNDVSAVAARIRLWRDSGMLLADTGRRVRLEGRTICVHSDTPNAVSVAKVVGRAGLLGRNA